MMTMDQSVNPTRWEILTALKRQGGMTVEEVADHLGTSGMTARYHLGVLRAAGLVQCRRRRGAVGRPVEVYQLTEVADELFPRRYDVLVLDVLRYLEEWDGEERLQAIFARRAAELYDAVAPRLTGKTFEEKVAEMARVLDEIGHLTAWRRDGDAFVLTEHNCALASVSERYPHLCRSEAQLLERCLGTEVRRVQHRSSGHHCCSYVIPIPEGEA